MMKVPEKFTPTPEQISAAESVFMAMANLAIVKPVVDAYQKEILGRYRWKPDPLLEHLSDERRGEILDPKDAYLLSSKDADVFYKECQKARIAAGLHINDPDFEPEFCPALVAEELLRQARRVMVNSFKPVTGIDADQIIRSNFKEYGRYVELCLKLMAPYCNPKERLDQINAQATEIRRERQSAGA
jgi:hypothetical protein